MEAAEERRCAYQKDYGTADMDEPHCTTPHFSAEWPALKGTRFKMLSAARLPGSSQRFHPKSLSSQGDLSAKDHVSQVTVF